MKRGLVLITLFFLFINTVWAQLPEGGDWKTRMGSVSPAKARTLYNRVFAKGSPITDIKNSEGINLNFYIEEFRPLMELAPYCDYVFYSGYLYQEQTDGSGNTTLSFYQKLLDKIEDPAVRMIIVEDILKLGRQFVDNLDSVNVVRAKTDTLSMPVAMTKYAHLYYKYAGDNNYYPSHLYDKNQACENFRSAFKILRENNINPGEELEAFYVNEYYKACEQLYRSDEQKYYETFLQDYLEIVKTCDNLLIPYYNIPDSVKNNVADAKYSAFRSYNYYTNHSEHGIKSLFRQSGAADPERLNNYYMAQLKEHRRDTAYLNRAINVLNENNCSQTPAFYSYCEASYMINPTYMNCIGCAFASKEDGLRDDMIKYFVEAYNLADTDLQRGLIAYQIGCANNTPIPTNDIKSAEYSKWVNDMNTAYSNLKKVLDVQMAFSESTSIQVREIPARTAFELAQNRYRLRYTLTSIAEMDEAASYVKLAMEAAPDLYNNPINQIGPKLMKQITERRQKLIADAKNAAVRKAQEKAYAEYLKKKQAEDDFWNQR